MAEERIVAVSWQQILDSFEKDYNGMPIANKYEWNAFNLVKKVESYKVCDRFSLDPIRTHLQKWGYPTIQLYLSPAEPVLAIIWNLVITE